MGDRCGTCDINTPARPDWGRHNEFRFDRHMVNFPPKRRNADIALTDWKPDSRGRSTAIHNSYEAQMFLARSQRRGRFQDSLGMAGNFHVLPDLRDTPVAADQERRAAHPHELA